MYDLTSKHLYTIFYLEIRQISAFCRVIQNFVFLYRIPFVVAQAALPCFPTYHIPSAVKHKHQIRGCRVWNIRVC